MLLRGDLGLVGNHRLACGSSGRLTRRGRALELAFAQLLKEAGGRGAVVSSRPFLRDLGVPGVAAHDHRELDVVARGLPLFGGRPLVVDATLRSPLTSAGFVRFAADLSDGATFRRARQDKEQKYPELLGQAHRLKFVVAACEVGGRCSDECVDLVRALVMHRAMQAAPALRGSVRACLARRYWGIISVAIQRAVAVSLLDAPPLEEAHAYPPPTLDCLLAGGDAPYGADAPEVSRLPPDLSAL